MCNLSDSVDNLVGCDNCEAWAHYQCAGVTDSISEIDRSWHCPKCRRGSALVNEIPNPRSERSAGSRPSRRSGSHLRMLEEQRLLRLKALEEETEIQQKRAEKKLEIEEQYIREKYTSLSDTSSIGSTRRSISSRSSVQIVENWLACPTTASTGGLLSSVPVTGPYEQAAVEKRLGFALRHENNSPLQTGITPTSASTPQTASIFPMISTNSLIASISSIASTTMMKCDSANSVGHLKLTQSNAGYRIATSVCQPSKTQYLDATRVPTSLNVLSQQLQTGFDAHFIPTTKYTGAIPKTVAQMTFGTNAEIGKIHRPKLTIAETFGRVKFPSNLHRRSAPCRVDFEPKTIDQSKDVNLKAVECVTTPCCIHTILQKMFHNLALQRTPREEKEIKTVAFLDDGSSSSLLDAEIAEAIGLEGIQDSFSLTWTSNISREEKNSKRVAIELRSTNGEKGFKLGNVRTVNQLKLPLQSLDYDEMQKHYPHLRGLPVESYSNVSPGIIIGIEHVHLLTQLKIREGRQDEYMDNVSLHQQISKFYGIEEASTNNVHQSEADKLAVEILNKTTQRLKDRFETGLPWRFNLPDFPNSFEMARSRMVSLEKRLQKDPQLELAVKQQVSSYLEKNYAHIATEEELNKTDPRRVWYLPLGVVQNPKKPGKVRLIWDAAARVNKISFNDMLLTGPDLLTSLPSILLRFRQKNIAVCGDIKEMFHQIRIRAQDSQSQRFLYRSNPKDQPQVYVMDVVTFGATCSPFISQFIKNKNATDHAEDYPEAAKAIIKDHYMDDYLQSVDTIEEAVARVLDVKYVQARGGFEIRNFLSNSPEVLIQIGEPRLPEKKSLNLEPGIEESDRAERILGMMWLPASDHLTFSTSLHDEISKFVGGELKPTKRQVLRTIMSIFDPLGLIAHYVVHGKILMQEIWKHGSDWDERIPDELFEKWNRCCELLKNLDVVRVPRCFFSGMVSNEFENLQLHMFVDASEAAYACVAYLRVLHHDVPRCAFVAAKTKVAPLRPLSIPRLELQAALKGSREMNNICSSLDLHIKQRFLWTDSQTVLAWLRSDSRKYHQFVSYRVGEILSTTTISEWRYIPSKLNVADKATKWDSGPDFSPNNTWFTGPQFLLDPESEWPQDKKVSNTIQDVRIHFLHHFEAPTYFIIDPCRFSLWSRLLRSTTYVIRASNKFRKSGKSGILTSEEFLTAENVLWRQVQAESFPAEYASLKSNQNCVGKHSELYKLSPFLDDYGVMRIDSRIREAPTAPYNTKFPIILPKTHRITFLLVDSFHRRFVHGNAETILNEMRQQFHVTSLRSVIKKVAKNCLLCRIKGALPRPPRMAPLPMVRLTPYIRPFTHTGIDYFGPILVKQNRSLVKRWGVLFTCLTIRAVHIEVAHSLSSNACILAIRRFIARRGSPTSFYSDQGTNFRGAKNILLEQIQNIQTDCAATFTNSNTRWILNPPATPHMGGAWERMVRSIKRAMEGIADYCRNPCDEVLETVVLEAEAIVNSRPLTYIPISSETDEAITPNHFLLYGDKGITQPMSETKSEGNVLRDSWQLASKLADVFWSRWIHEYLPTLTRRTKWFEPIKPLKPGDVVILVDEKRRNGWTKGLVLEVIKGIDNQVRWAKIKTSMGITEKSVVNLALLDIRSASQNEEYPASPTLHGEGDVAGTPGIGQP
ncbi:uncharacterized protein LOC129760983 [Uranotaenia lowii]|uniref:uncharacterized protein LOC129760983 n=1 Tax=Uranotaenia lowii TaxID=190385 RepID=UPI0024786674|nr:uncharacterized protein LOC129760983 [Uranotaenia lowii]